MLRPLIRRLLAVAFVAILGLVLWNVGKRQSLESVLDIAQSASERLPELLRRIRNFHRVVTRDGLTVLEVSAKEASYFKNDRAVVILEPSIVFYDKGEKAGVLSGAEGRLYLDGNEFEAIELSGRVLFELAGFKLATSKLFYNREEGIIRAQGATRLESPDLLLTGHDLSIDIKQRKLIMSADVRMELRETAG